MHRTWGIFLAFLSNACVATFEERCEQMAEGYIVLIYRAGLSQ